MMSLKNDRSPAEHEEFLARYRQWRAQADDEFIRQRDAVLALIRPYRSLPLLGYVYFSETTADPETYREWQHRGIAAKVEHYALLLAARETDGLEDIVPVEVSSAVYAYLDYVFANLAPYYDEFDDGGSPTDPDPRSLVLMWELGVRMPLYSWQYRATLIQLFDPIATWMEASLGFTIRDALAVDSAFERETNAMLARETPGLSEGMARIRQVISIEGPNEVALKGNASEEEARRLLNEYQDRYSTIMARIGDGIALDLPTVASAANIEEPRAFAVLSFFTTDRDRIPNNYFIPVPDSPLKVRPFIPFEGRWTLPSSMLFSPAMQPALERALNPAFGSASADKDTWNTYESRRANLVEERSAAALSRLLDGAKVHRNLKYKTMPGQASPYELDGLALRDGKLVLLECKAGAFSSAARRGDIDALEERISSLVSDAHRQAVRALDYINASPEPVFRVDGASVVIEKASVEEVFLITTTLEEMGFLTARFNEVGRLATSTLTQTPWVVPLHDLELISKYVGTAAEFIHYLKRRIALNAQRAVGALDEMDWLGRYFYDALALADVRDFLDADPLATASLASHTTEIDDYENFENGIRTTPAPFPASNVHESIRKMIDGLTRWAGPGYINAGIALLDLPAKQQRAFAKRIARATRNLRAGSYVQEHAASDDREIAFVCTIVDPDLDLSLIADGSAYGTAKRNVHLMIDSAYDLQGVRQSRLPSEVTSTPQPL